MLFLALLEMTRAFTGRASAKEAFENQARIRLRRDRRRGGTPGQIVLVGAGITGVARAGLTDRIAGEFERRKAREMAYAFCGKLIDGNARVNVSASGLLDAHTGEKSSARARMVA